MPGSVRFGSGSVRLGLATSAGTAHVGELVAPLLSDRPHLDGHLLVPLARRHVQYVLDGLRRLLAQQTDRPTDKRTACASDAAKRHKEH